MNLDKWQDGAAVAGARAAADSGAAVRVQGLTLLRRGKAILQGLDFTLPNTGITSLIGPSGAGKSSLLHCLNGLITDWQGEVRVAGRDVRSWPGGWEALRVHVGLIGQKPVVFPCSIRANVVFGIRGFWRRRRMGRSSLVEQCLRQAALWDEVADRLDRPAEELSLGQQQRLCLARALAVRPRLLLLDEPTASLDPRSKQLIEQSLKQLAHELPVLCVTHDLAQAQRLGEQVMFICEGRLIEHADSKVFFQRPQALESREFLRWSVCQC